MIYINYQNYKRAGHRVTARLYIFMTHQETPLALNSMQCVFENSK